MSDEEIQRLKVERDGYKAGREHYVEQYTTLCAQVAECCEIMGVDPTKVPHDAWTLRESVRALVRRLEVLEKTLAELKARRLPPPPHKGGHVDEGGQAAQAESSVSDDPDQHLQRSPEMVFPRLRRD